MDQSPAVAFTAFADVWSRATGNGDRRHPMHHWRERKCVFDVSYIYRLGSYILLETNFLIFWVKNVPLPLTLGAK